MQTIQFAILKGIKSGQSRPRFSLFALWQSVVLLLGLSVLPAHAQFGSSLSGSVLDPSGAAIPNATVMLTNKGTQQAQTVTTNGTGAFQFNELAPGNYSLVVTADGFKKNNLTDVAIAAETPRSVNVNMQTGGAVESVNVTAN